MITKFLANLLAAILVLFGLNPSGPPSPATLHYPKDQVVLQLAHGGGFRMIDRASDEIPDMTIWGDGRVVFAAPDGTIREGRSDPAVVDRLVRDATFLYGLADHYSAATHTDDATATFTVLTDRGRKTVSVYALNPAGEPQEGEPYPAIFAQLRRLWAEVSATLPANAPEMKPTKVNVITLLSNETATAEWPAELQGRLSGAQASQAVALAGLGRAKTFMLKGEPHLVLVIPVIPNPTDWDGQ